MGHSFCPVSPASFFYLTSSFLANTDVPEKLWDAGTDLDKTGTGQTYFLSITMGNYIVRLKPKDTIITLSKLPVTLLSLLMIIAIALITKKISGKASSLLATSLLCFSPDIIANSSLATPDMPDGIKIS